MFYAQLLNIFIFIISKNKSINIFIIKNLCILFIIISSYCNKEMPQLQIERRKGQSKINIDTVIYCMVIRSTK